MSKRLLKKYKIIKFYKEDLWGKLAYNPNKLSKGNYIVLEKQHEKFYYRFEISKIKFQLKQAFKISIRFRPKRFSKNQKNWLKIQLENNKRYQIFRRNKNLRYKQYLKVLKAHVKLFRETRARPSFNFRTDIGNPKRKKKRLSNFAKQLKNRHKLRRFLTATISIKQLRNYVLKVHHYTSLSLYFSRLIETRLDVIIYRLNLIKNSNQTRQLINHGNFLINGKIVYFSNINLNLFDIFSVKNKKSFFLTVLNSIKHGQFFFSIPHYIEINFRIMSAIIYRNPLPKHIFYPSKTSFLYLASSAYKFRKR